MYLQNERLRHGVFLRDFSFAKGVSVQGSELCLDDSPLAEAIRRKHDVLTLLLVFDIAHIPLAQSIYQGTDFDAQVLSRFLQDDDIMSLAELELLTITTPQQKRATSIHNYLDKREKDKWVFSDQPSDETISRLNSFSKGILFDNVDASRTGLHIFRQKLLEYRHVFRDSYDSIIRCIEATLTLSDGYFTIETFLPILMKTVSPDVLSNVSMILDFVYFQPTNGSGIIFHVYTDRIVKSELMLPITSSQHVSFFYSPQYIRSIFSEATSSIGWANYLSSPNFIKELRLDERWHLFSHQYHTQFVPDMSKKLRIEYLKGLTGAYPSTDLKYQSELTNSLLPNLELWTQLGSTVKLAGIINFILGTRPVRNVSRYLLYPDIREYMKLFHSVVRGPNGR